MEGLQIACDTNRWPVDADEATSTVRAARETASASASASALPLALGLANKGSALPSSAALAATGAFFDDEQPEPRSRSALVATGAGGAGWSAMRVQRRRKLAKLMKFD